MEACTGNMIKKRQTSFTLDKKTRISLSRRLAAVQCREYEYDLIEMKFFSPTKFRISKNVKTIFLFLFSFKLDGMKFESVFSDYDNNFS